MAAIELPPQALLNQLLSYDAETGKLFWKERPVEMFKAERFAKIWNTRFAGKEAMTTKSLGYMTGDINGITYRAHRVIWKMITGVDADDVDHINGIRDDNRFANLRDVSRAENRKNSAIRSDNTSGHVGVRKRKDCNRWEAYLMLDQRHIHVGTFKTLDDAIAARKAAERLHNFHPNHGRR